MRVNLSDRPRIESQECTDMLLPLATSELDINNQDNYHSSYIDRINVIRWRVKKLEDELLTHYTFNPDTFQFERSQDIIEEASIGIQELPLDNERTRLRQELRSSLLVASIKGCIQYVDQKIKSMLALLTNLKSYASTGEANFVATQGYTYYDARKEIISLEKMRVFVLNSCRPYLGTTGLKDEFLTLVEKALRLIVIVGSQTNSLERFCNSQQVYNISVHICNISSIFLSKCDVSDCLQFILPGNVIDIPKLKGFLSPFDEEIQKARELAIQPQDFARLKQAEEAWLNYKNQLLINTAMIT